MADEVKLEYAADDQQVAEAGGSLTMERGKFEADEARNALNKKLLQWNVVALDHTPCWLPLAVVPAMAACSAT